MSPWPERWQAAATAGVGVLRTVPGVSEEAAEDAFDRIALAFARYAHDATRMMSSEKFTSNHADTLAGIRRALLAAEKEKAEELAGPHDGYCSDRQPIDVHMADCDKWQEDLETTIRCLRRIEAYHQRQEAYWSDPAMRRRSSDDPARKQFVNRLADVFCHAKGIDRSSMMLSTSDGPRSYAMNFLVAVLRHCFEDWEPDRRSIMRWVDRKSDNFV